MRRARNGVLLALASALVALLSWSGSLHRLEVRSTAWLVQTGHTWAAAAPGQAFVDELGFERLELHVTPIGEAPPEELELVLRRNGPGGMELGRALGSSFRPTALGGWLGFEFPGLDLSPGVVHAELRPAGERDWSHVAVWTRLRGKPQGRWSWGADSRSGPVVEGEFLSEQPDLRGLAFACRDVQGSVRCTLIDGADGRELATSTLELPASVVDGWIAFELEPQAQSRWRTYRYRVELSEDSRLVAVGREPTMTSWHGSGSVDERLVGATLGAEPLAGRDLVLRTGPAGTFDSLTSLLPGRMGPRFWPVVLLWLAACALLWTAVPRRD